jgi:hypothetical protein
MAGVGRAKGGGSGGARPGAGRPKGSRNPNPKPRPLLTTADLAAVVRRELAAQASPPAASPAATPSAEGPALAQQLAAIGRQLQILARQTEREPMLRRLAAIERAVGVLEMPKAPRVSRARPLGRE